MKKNRKRNRRYLCYGFTLVEIIVVVVILGFVAFLAIPMVSNSADIQVRAAANRIAADLEYAKGLAITHQQSYSVVFDIANESYDVRVAPAGSGDVIDNPLNPGQEFAVDFSADNNTSRVDIVCADFDANATCAITFDYLGSPHSGTALPSYLNFGQIMLQSDNFTLTIDIEPMTGFISIN